MLSSGRSTEFIPYLEMPSQHLEAKKFSKADSIAMCRAFSHPTPEIRAKRWHRCQHHAESACQRMNPAADPEGDAPISSSNRGRIMAPSRRPLSACLRSPSAPCERIQHRDGIVGWTVQKLRKNRRLRYGQPRLRIPQPHLLDIRIPIASNLPAFIADSVPRPMNAIPGSLVFWSRLFHHWQLDAVDQYKARILRC